MKRFLPFVFTLLFLALLFYLLPFKDLFESLRRISIYHLLTSFLFYSLSQLVRSVRWSLILDLELYHAYLINSANVMLNNILPARTGELSWFYYAKKLGVGTGMSLWSFFLGRFFDLIALSLLLFLNLSLLSHLFLIPSLMLFVFSLSFHKAVRLLPDYKKLKEFKGFVYENSNLRLFLSLLLLSSLSHLLKFISFLSLLGLWHIDLYRSFLAFSGGELSSTLPFHSFMGFGTYEFAFSLPLRVLGESLRDWLRYGFIFHSFLLFSSALWGVPALLLLSKR